MVLFFKAARLAVGEFLDDKALRLSAALSYYSIFSLAPLLLLAISVAGLVYGDEAARGMIDDELVSIMGAPAATGVQELLANSRKSSDSILATITGLILLLVGAGGVFGQLQDALNEVWNVPPRSGGSWKTMLRDRFLSYTMVLGSGFLLLVSLVLTTTVQAAHDTLGNWLPVHPALWTLAGSLVSFCMITVLFGAIFKILPDAGIEWRDVREGALVTALLFVLGKYFLGWYLAREATASSYGPAGSLVLILLWVYYSSIILLFGAEFTQVHARLRGRDIRGRNDAGT
jgi:membrane protein